jgi:hypothetical protein
MGFCGVQQTTHVVCPYTSKRVSIGLSGLSSWLRLNVFEEVTTHNSPKNSHRRSVLLTQKLNEVNQFISESPSW